MILITRLIAIFTHTICFGIKKFLFIVIINFTLNLYYIVFFKLVNNIANYLQIYFKLFSVNIALQPVFIFLIKAFLFASRALITVNTFINKQTICM